ncbi:MAG TPA: hydroxymethylbilane synthase [Candidatus Acidoferrales bacterium]|nr:hydroxymethylbilane synthase [Candidatus Acidoferrales bacterium]
MRRTIRIGTRGSMLALAQSRWVQASLQQLHPDAAVELVTIKTSGDRFLDQPLSAIGGKGLFVKEIEEALAANRIDCAVHSMKDVPAALAAGLVIAAVPAREDPRDVLITARGIGVDQLPRGARVGTSSLRRMALLRAQRGDLSVLSLRGNVDSRLRKLDAGEVDAIVLAAAGLRRLGIEHAGVTFFDALDFIPAIGQGALAIESRADETAALLSPLDHAETRIAVSAERAFLLRVSGSCRTPLAAHATVRGDTLELRALIARPDGTRVVRGARSGGVGAATGLGTELAHELLDRGGAEILRALGEAADAG